MLSPEQIKSYHQDGYLIVRKFLNDREATRLYEVAIADKTAAAHAVGTVDKSGKQTRLTLWYTPGDDTYSLLTRSRKMINSVTQLLDSEAPVCHYHSKLMQKEPRVGGAWEWHQDYGYWYKNQFMFPDQLISVMVAITQATKANGCLQVIKGSHKLGRVNHGFSGEQVGADMVFVENALKTMPLVYCELEPGDALFFHANLLHRSEANISETARWSLISCYNSQSNPAYNEPSHSYQIPVEIVPDEVILQESVSGISPETDFLKLENDNALKPSGWEDEVKA